MVCSQLEQVKKGVELEWAESVRRLQQGGSETSRMLILPTRKSVLLDCASVGVEAVEEFHVLSDRSLEHRRLTESL